MYIPQRSGNVCPCKHLHVNIYSTIIRVIALTQKQPKYSLTDEQIHKMECIDTLEYYFGHKVKKIETCYNMNEPGKHYASERSQTQKTRYCLTPEQANLGRTERLAIAWGWGVEDVEDRMVRTTNESRVSSGVMRCSKIDYVMAA